MQTPPSSDPIAPAKGLGLVRRIHLPRAVGLGLGGIAVGAALWQNQAPAWLWLGLVWNGLLWPHVAYAWASRSRTPYAAEHRNLLLDSAMGGFWLPAMGFNLLPSVLIIAMLTMDNVAMGGKRLLLRGLLAQFAGLGLGLTLLDVRWVTLPTLPTLLACLPFLVTFPIVIGVITHRLATRLSQQKKALERSEQLHRQVLDAIDAGIVLFDADDRLVMCNEDYRKLHRPIEHLLKPGERFEELLRACIARGLVPQARGRELEWLAERMRQHREPQGALCREVSDGSWRRLIEKRLPDGGLLAFCTDVTELMENERALEAARSQAQQARRALEDAIEALPDGFALYDAQDRLVLCNQAYRTMYAETAPAMQPGASFESLLRYGLQHGQYPEALGREDEWLQERLHQHRAANAAVLQELPGNRWLRIHERPTRDGGQAGVRTDVTALVHREQELARLNAELDKYTLALREANTRLEHLSLTDPLTGLANRRQFDQRLEDEWERARRHGETISLVMIDIDHFKRFNDAHGHLVGDQCLRAVAQALQECAQRGGDLVARYGGEEFAILLPRSAAAEARVVAQRCLAMVDGAAIAHNDSPVAGNVTLSIGVAAMRPYGSRKPASALVKEADAALYEAKQTGRHRVASAAA